MNVPTSAFHYHDGVIGPTPTIWCGVDLPDGDSLEFASAGVGSVYTYIDTTSEFSIQYTKVKNDGADNDWSRGLGVIRQTVTYDQFTDGGSTTGTIVLDEAIPSGALVIRSTVTGITGFTGNTSATVAIGDGTDADRYMTGTPSVYTTASAVSVGDCSGVEIHTAAANITVTVTANSDFTSVSAGQMTVSLYYLM